MKVILLDTVAKVGNKYEVKEVADGYALNFLIPQKLAEFATPAALARIQKIEEKVAGEREAQHEAQLANLKTVDGKEVAFALSANEQGGLFATLSAEEILEAINGQFGTDFASDQLSVDVVKEVGEHEATLNIGEASASVKVVVTPEEEK